MTIAFDPDDLAGRRADLPPPRRLDGAFSVESYLAALDPVRLDDPAVRQVLEALRRKVEIARRLAAHYQPDMRRPQGDAVIAPAYAGYLCMLYLAIAERERDWRSLNAALKMLGGILPEPLPATAALEAWAERLLAAVQFPDA